MSYPDWNLVRHGGFLGSSRIRSSRKRWSRRGKGLAGGGERGAEGRDPGRGGGDMVWIPELLLLAGCRRGQGRGTRLISPRNGPIPMNKLAAQDTIVCLWLLKTTI
jgi:hypothetical protein